MTIVEVAALPSGGGGVERIPSLPRLLVRYGGQRIHRYVFGAHEAVELAVDAQCTHEREVASGPVLDLTVVETVGRRPRAGVGIDGYERVCRSPQVVFHGLGCRA